MSYGANILKNEAGYYSLYNASIVGGILHINAGGGSATQQITTSDLAAVTANMLFTCICDRYSNEYVPDFTALIHLKNSKSQRYTNLQIYPLSMQNGICEMPVELPDGEYDEMYFTISSDKEVTITLWELAPEITDADVEVIIDGVRQSLPRLLYDYNSSIFSGDLQETSIAYITCTLLQNTDIQGHFVFTFDNTADCCMTIRFYDNNTEELFSPLYYDLHAGHNSIGIPHAYVSRLAGYHSFVVTAQVSSGIFTVPTRGALFTIDAGYLAKRELEIAMDITDLTIRQLSSDNGPDEIWVVGIDAGEILVRKRAYNLTNASAGFEAVGSMGEGDVAALEFDGDWILRDDDTQYTIETEEEPWVFWVKDEILYGKQGITTNSPIIRLATYVASYVKAVRGYSSLVYKDRDQGLTIIYADLDGNVFARSYSYVPEYGRKEWLEAQVLKSNVAVQALNIHRLNDYRIGFEITTDTENLWLISDRNYVGQSVRRENISTAIFEDFDNYVPLTGYYPSDWLFEQPTIIATRRWQETHIRDYEEKVTAIYIYSYEQEQRGAYLGTEEELKNKGYAEEYDSIGMYIYIPNTPQEVFYRYDYDTDTKGAYLGTVKEILSQGYIEGYDEYGRLYIYQEETPGDWIYVRIYTETPEIQKIYVKAYTEYRTRSEEYVEYYFEFTCSQHLFSSEKYFDLKDRFTWTGISKSYLTDVSWERNDSALFTIVKFTFSEFAKPALLVSAMMVDNPYWRVYDGTYVWYPKVLLNPIWDATVYFTEKSNDAIGFLRPEGNIVYNKVNYNDIVSREDTAKISTQGDVIYLKHEKISASSEEASIVLGGIKATINYLDGSGEPV